MVQFLSGPQAAEYIKDGDSMLTTARTLAGVATHASSLFSSGCCRCCCRMRGARS